jgi:Spondin_N
MNGIGFAQLTLMDAGTDTGFTFTSPNWPSDHPQPISVITAQYPDHPASSFYYPDLKHLPVIATLQFTKVNYHFISKFAKFVLLVFSIAICQEKLISSLTIIYFSFFTKKNKTILKSL